MGVTDKLLNFMHLNNDEDYYDDYYDEDDDDDYDDDKEEYHVKGTSGSKELLVECGIGSVQVNFTES